MYFIGPLENRYGECVIERKRERFSTKNTQKIQINSMFVEMLNRTSEISNGSGRVDALLVNHLQDNDLIKIELGKKL